MDNEHTIQLGDTVEILVDNQYKETFEIDDQKLLAHLLIGKKENYEEYMDLGLGAPRTVKVLKITPKGE